MNDIASNIIRDHFDLAKKRQGINLDEGALREEVNSSLIDEETKEQSQQFDEDKLADLVSMLKSGDEVRARNAIAALPALEFERLRKVLAKKSGIRPTVIDELRKPSTQDATAQGQSLDLVDPIPSVDVQDGSRLLDDVAKQIHRFLVADDSSIIGMSLWIAWTYLVDHVQVAPNLVFSSPVRACGKTTALEIVSRLVPRALPVSGISSAALFRTIEAMKPTLIVDEVDTVFKTNEELRTLTNAGFTRTAARVVRVVGDKLEPRMFSTWGAKALALIGKLPDTLESRSVIIPMRRKRPEEMTSRLRSDLDQGFRELQSRLARWTLDNVEGVVQLDPVIPNSLSDRQGDCWRELFRVADSIGGDWPQKARSAAIEICSRADVDEGNVLTRLLVDIKALFDGNPTQSAWPTVSILDHLNALEGAPWLDFNKGSGINAQKLAKLLSKFKIAPRSVRIKEHTPKGYYVESFSEAFSRFLPQSRNNATELDKTLSSKDIGCCDAVPDVIINRNLTIPSSLCCVSTPQQKRHHFDDKSILGIEMSSSVAVLHESSEVQHQDVLDDVFEDMELGA